MKSGFALSIAVLSAIVLMSSSSLAQDWTLRSPATSPSAREDPAMAQFGDKVLLFGGFDSSGTGRVLDDTWLWDGTNWTQITSFGIFGTGPHPPARSNASMAFDPVSNQVVLFGGVGAGNVTLGDTWTFTLASNAFLRRSFFSWGQPSVSQSPPARHHAAMEFDPNTDTIILSDGAQTNGANLSDTWSFDPGSSFVAPSWTKINITSPSARNASKMAKCGLVINNGFFNVNISPTQLLQFGGISSTTAGLGDSWMLGGTIDTLNWTGPLTPSPSPSGRFQHGMAYYPTSNRVVLFGGFGAGILNDTWNGLCGGVVSWAHFFPAHSPDPRFSPGMATGPDGFTVVLFGGRKLGGQTNETWTWGRTVACVPARGSQIPVGSEVKCQFDATGGAVFGGWTADGFAPPTRDQTTVTFHTEAPGGSAFITAQWSDSTGFHSETLDYLIVRPH